MCIYIDIRTSEKVEERLGNYTWPFEKQPELPFQNHGEIWHIGWEIPTRWAVDASGQRWEDNAHGHPLQPIDPYETSVIDLEQAAERLHKLIRECEPGTLAALYESAFDAVKSCDQSDKENYLIITYHRGCKPKNES